MKKELIETLSKSLEDGRNGVTGCLHSGKSQLTGFTISNEINIHTVNNLAAVNGFHFPDIIPEERGLLNAIGGT